MPPRPSSRWSEYSPARAVWRSRKSGEGWVMKENVYRPSLAQHPAEVPDHVNVVPLHITEDRHVPAIVRHAEIRARVRQGPQALGAPTRRNPVKHPSAFRLTKNRHGA